MTVLVTGGAGYIGSHMVLNLCDAGEKVVVLDDLSTGRDWAVDRRARLVVGGAGDSALVGRVIAEEGVDAIIHFAGSIVVPESVTDPLKYYANNTCVSRSLIEAAVKAGCGSFIFSSTAAVYGMTGLDPVAETDALSAHVALWPLQADDRDDAGRRRGGAWHRLWRPALLQRRRRRSGGAFGPEHALCHPSDQGGGAGGARPARRHGDLRHRLPDARTAPASATTSMSPTSSPPTPWCSATCAPAGRASCSIAAMAMGSSVTEVVDARQIGQRRRFPGHACRRAAPAIRRPSSPIPSRIQTTLGWVPAHDDLDEIVAHAYGWERKLMTRNDEN